MSARLLLLNRGKVWRDMLLVLGLSIILPVIAALWILTRRDDSASSFAWMYRHRLFAGGIAAFAAGVVVSRHRALQRADAVRSWLSALPVHPATARWEALAIEAAPVVGAICVSTTTFGSVGAIAAFTSAISGIELAATWFAIHAGVVLGALIGYWVPAPKPIDLPPGSRYVPHRRVVRTSSLRPTLSALGLWPVRQTFASARPKAVGRAVMPILLLMPLGSSADTAMVVTALFVVLGGVFLLVAATISVSKASCRWLQPLPLRAAALARALLLRPLAVILGAAAVAVWLFWVIGAPAGHSVMRGLLLLILSSVMAVVGSVGAIYRTTKSRQ